MPRYGKSYVSRFLSFYEKLNQFCKRSWKNPLKIKHNLQHHPFLPDKSEAGGVD
jgi:hypothetical protein